MKMNKMQLNRVEASLANLKSAKIAKFKEEHPVETSSALLDEVIRWAESDPAKFVEVAVRACREYGGVHVRSVFERTPPYLDAQARYREAVAKCVAPLAKYVAAQDDEIRRIVDSRYLSDSEDALKRIAGFEKFEPKVKAK